MIDTEMFKILVVDDEKTNLDVLDHILSPLYDVMVAKSGQAALKMARSYKPDLILLDVIMPDMSGFNVLTELKNSDLTKGIPVIFITGLDSSKDEEKGLLLGAVDYITKPFRNSIVMARVGTHLKIVEQMRKIERLGMIDSLTDLPNRRSFDHQINVEWGRAVREKTSIAMLMLDIDNFKDFNDKFGHTQGDVVLITMARLIERSLKRSADFAARWGGEEFAVLLPGTDMSGATEIAERIRIAVERTNIPFAGRDDVSVTVSIGVHTEAPQPNSSLSDFIARTDDKLYMAKNAGRNKVYA